MDTLIIVFQVFLPVIVIAIVSLGIYFLMQALPEDVKDFLNFDLFNPKKRK